MNLHLEIITPTMFKNIEKLRELTMKWTEYLGYIRYVRFIKDSIKSESRMNKLRAEEVCTHDKTLADNLMKLVEQQNNIVKYISIKLEEVNKNKE